jgi:hypothetical protein
VAIAHQARIAAERAATARETRHRANAAQPLTWRQPG